MPDPDFALTTRQLPDGGDDALARAEAAERSRDRYRAALEQIANEVIPAMERDIINKQTAAAALRIVARLLRAALLEEEPA